MQTTGSKNVYREIMDRVKSGEVVDEAFLQANHSILMNQEAIFVCLTPKPFGLDKERSAIPPIMWAAMLPSSNANAKVILTYMVKECGMDLNDTYQVPNATTTIVIIIIRALFVCTTFYSD